MCLVSVTFPESWNLFTNGFLLDMGKNANYALIINFILSPSYLAFVFDLWHHFCGTCISTFSEQTRYFGRTQNTSKSQVFLTAFFILQNFSSCYHRFIETHTAFSQYVAGKFEGYGIGILFCFTAPVISWFILQVEKVWCGLLTLVDEVLLPSISLLECNSSLAEEIWAMLCRFPYELRCVMFHNLLR